MATPANVMQRRFACLVLLSSLLLGTSYGEARWSDLSAGKSEPEVFAILGAPLIMHGGRGYRQWTYDAGGEVMFRQGVVIYWDLPNGYQVTHAAPAPVPAVAKVVTAPAKAPEPVPTPDLVALAKLNPDSYDPHAEHREPEDPEAFVTVRVHR